MGYTLLQFKAEDTCIQALTREALSRAVTSADIKAVLLQEGMREQREGCVSSENG